MRMCAFESAGQSIKLVCDFMKFNPNGIGYKLSENDSRL